MADPRLRRLAPALLRRAGLEKGFNYVHPLRLGGRRFDIPLEGGFGETLLKLEPDFKFDVVTLFADSTPGWFVDIGANIGQTVLEAFAARRWERYFALEPDLVAAGYIRRLVELNDLPVDVAPWAAGTHAAPQQLRSKGAADASATMAPEARPGAYDARTSRWVPAYPLDRLLDLAPMPKGLTIKIDVEGFECDVLDGAREILTSLRPLLICEVLRAYSPEEVGPVHARMERLEQILSSHGYRIFYIEMEEGSAERLRGFRQVAAFPRGEWKDNPTGYDYLFAPAEMALPFPVVR
ncbi:MAG: FkbM family methyltransferase [Caulobacteraceae bacterium]